TATTPRGHPARSSGPRATRAEGAAACRGKRGYSAADGRHPPASGASRPIPRRRRRPRHGGTAAAEGGPALAALVPTADHGSGRSPGSTPPPPRRQPLLRRAASGEEPTDQPHDGGEDHPLKQDLRRDAAREGQLAEGLPVH